MDKNLQSDYTKRIGRVFDYIDENLDADLSLSKIAAVALFSPYHFHRVFRFVTKETLNDYVTRRRIEKSALAILHKDMEMSEVARTFGFNDASSFSRSFKKYYKLSPTKFKETHPNEFSKIRQLESKNGQVYPTSEEYICIINNLKKWIEMNANIEVKEIAEMKLAGVSHIGVQGVESAFDKLIRWAAPKGLMGNPSTKLGRVFYDSMKVTAPDKVRMNVFLKSDAAFEVDGEVSGLTIERSKCIVGRFEITPNEFEQSWTGLYVWMNENGYKTSGGNPYEIYHNDYREHPKGKFMVDLCIPVE